MRTIYKYPLEIVDEQTIEVPNGAAFLDVQMQEGTPCIWCVVDPDVEKKRYKVWIVGTGHPAVKAPAFYLGTFQIHGRGLVFHVFTDIHPHFK